MSLSNDDATSRQQAVAASPGAPPRRAQPQWLGLGPKSWGSNRGSKRRPQQHEREGGEGGLWF
jgi:hypothetical protein